MCFFVAKSSFEHLSATVTANVIRLRPPLGRTKNRYAQAIIWKETTEKKGFKNYRVSKMLFF